MQDFVILFVMYACILLTSLQSRNYTIEFYTTLIRKEVQRSKSSQKPQSAEEYKPAIFAGSVVNIGKFDYIIIGGGSSGAVVANRLSEVPSLNILLIEAGDYGNDFTDIPAMGMYSRNLGYDWGFYSTPQSTACLGLPEKRCPCPRGKGLGGTSLINGNIYARGNKADFDEWAKAGNPSWSYRNVLRAFKKSENSKIDGDEGYHGVRGNINIEYYKPVSVMSQAFIDANIALGRKLIDYNGKEQLGVGRTQFTKINGKRDSTGNAFIHPARHRSNLQILTNSYVTQILINNFTIAHGVMFSNKTGWYVAEAIGEVIVSAGAISSPQILMNSGVGPAADLLNNSIPVKKNLPVGRNLKDHAAFWLEFSTNYTEKDETLVGDIEQFLEGGGPLTAEIYSPSVAFLQTHLVEILNLPDIELLMVPQAKLQIPIDNTKRNIFRIIVILLHPKSKGSVTLDNNNPYWYPVIDHNLLSDEFDRDINTLHSGIELALKLLETPAFQSHNVTLLQRDAPTCNSFGYLTKPYWFCVIRQLTATIYHPMGTCAMGPDPLQGSVVDNFLRVYGIKNLRVADASIIPFATSGHTNAPAIMIGEMVADFIKSDIA